MIAGEHVACAGYVISDSRCARRKYLAVRSLCKSLNGIGGRSDDEIACGIDDRLSDLRGEIRLESRNV